MRRAERRGATWRGAVWVALGAVVVAALSGCRGTPSAPDLGGLYDTPAQELGAARYPVIVIPGILGSKLEDSVTRQKVWGAFEFGAADADNPRGARAIALPIEPGVPLSERVDTVVATDVLDTVTADVLLLQNLEIGAYVDILLTLDAGRYRDQSLGESGAIDYGGLHYTCFQLAYDWRRDVSEAAALLHEQVLIAQDTHRWANGLDADAPVKVDVVAHSMGGLLLRYYLRYGPEPLPEHGSLPELTWAGAAHVSRAVIIGTPNAGSALSLRQLVRGWNLNPFFPNYRPAVLGTMPAIYQLLPRTRHGAVVDADTGAPIDVLDPAVWERYGWGLADPDADRYLAWLMPTIESRGARRAAALEHLRLSLARARQFHAAVDAPASPPAGTELYLFAGDAEPTVAVYEVRGDGRIRERSEGPGDGTVLRSSALMDERVGGSFRAYLDTPIGWTGVFFLNEDHIGLTRAESFTNNALYLLLEAPRPANDGSAAGGRATGGGAR